MKLNPHYSWDYLYNLGRAHYALGHYKQAAEYLLQALERNETPSHPRLFLVASYVQLGQQDDAEWEVMQLETSHPEMTLSHLQQTLPISDGELRNRLLNDLRSAGISE
jgi:tetratricopeptide (TPR) repeat protein